MHCHRILVSALFVDMSSLLTSFISKNYFLLSLVYVCVYIYMCMCVYIYMCMCVYIYTCVYVCVCAYVYIYMCIYVCMYVCMYVINYSTFCMSWTLNIFDSVWSNQ